MYSYDKALFESMEYFIDVVWHINMKTNEVLILEDKLRKELRGRLLTLDEIKKSAMEPEKNGYIHFIMDILKPENVADMKESFQIAARIFLDSRYHLLKGNVTPSIDKDGNVSDVYITFIDCQELVDAKDIKEEEVGKAVVSFENQISDTLSGARMGLWKIIFDGGSPKLIMDKTSSELVGAPAGISPEEAFIFLCEHIDVEYVPKLKKYVQNMLDGRPDEVIYPYNHPVLGTITIRCGGRIDKGYSGAGKQLRGYHQDISEQDRKLLLSQQALRVQVENKQRRILIYREISSILAMAKNIDSGINQVLRFLGETLGVSRVFIFEENNGELEDSTFEWCGKEIY